MEYKFFRIIRENIKIPFFIRFIVGSFLVLISMIPIILPIFPGSLVVGVFILIIGFLFVVPGKKVKHLIKVRKGIVYLFQNIHRKRIVKHKVKDIKYHVQNILKDSNNT